MGVRFALGTIMSVWAKKKQRTFLWIDRAATTRKVGVRVPTSTLAFCIEVNTPDSDSGDAGSIPATPVMPAWLNGESMRLLISMSPFDTGCGYSS